MTRLSDHSGARTLEKRADRGHKFSIINPVQIMLNQTVCGGDALLPSFMVAVGETGSFVGINISANQIAQLI